MADNKNTPDLEKENSELRAQLAKANTGGKIAGLPVRGSYLAKWTNDLTGKEQTRKVEFQPGAAGLRLRGHDGIFPTEAILSIANGKRPSKEQLAACPELESVSEEFAQQELTHLAVVNYGLLK